MRSGTCDADRHWNPKPIDTRARKRKIRYDKRRYRERWRIEASFCRLKDFRRVATCYDNLARNYASTVALAAVIAFRC
jgi:transposase